MGGRGSSSGGGGSGGGSGGGDLMEYYGQVDPNIIDILVDPGERDPEDDKSWLERTGEWLVNLGQDVWQYLTEPIDPDSPAGRYFQRQDELIRRIENGETLTAEDFRLTPEEYEFIASTALGLGPGALDLGQSLTIAGSRSIPAAFVDRIERMAAALARAGRNITTGDATGVDAIFAQYANQIYAIFDKTGKGAISASNVGGVLAAEQRGATVNYLAGGELTVPPVARLVNRSNQTATASDTILGIFTQEISKGTTRELTTAAKEGKNVLAVSVQGHQLPKLNKNGHWEPVEDARGIWEGLHRWVNTELPTLSDELPRVLNKYANRIGPDDVYIGRPSQYGNPFKIGVDGTREEVIEKYRQHVMANPGLLEEIRKLKGKNLVCFCSPKPCHGDVILELANDLIKP